MITQMYWSIQQQGPIYEMQQLEVLWGFPLEVLLDYLWDSDRQCNSTCLRNPEIKEC